MKHLENCATLSQRSRGRLTRLIRMSRWMPAAVAAGLLIAACGDEATEETEGPNSKASGGFASNDETGGATGNDDGTGGSRRGTGGGADGTGGEGGATQDYCGRFDPTNMDCGVCELTLEEACREQYSCETRGMPTCQEGLVSQAVEVGCGYIKTVWSGDVGDGGTAIWQSSTGLGGASPTVSRTLVYLTDSGQLSSGCYPRTVVGEEPDCDDWVSACGQDNLGGAGGAD